MSRNDVSSPPRPMAATFPQSMAEVRNAPAPETGDGVAGWVLRGPLTLALFALAAFQLSTWVPHYLTWPFWADHDVFATIAQGWDEGRLPYRDLYCNNFPGTIYLFWILGKAFGWGKTLPFYAVDAAMVMALGAVVLGWSRRRLGEFLPGLVGYLAFLSYYLGLDYAHAAQRDWQGPSIAVAGLLIAQGWPGAGGRLASALAMAIAVAFRPQTVLLLPAVVLAIDESARAPGEPFRKTVRALGAWGTAFAIGAAAAFAPLVVAGVAGDFVRGVRLAAYGGYYNRVTPMSILTRWIALVVPLRTLLVPLAIALLARRADSPARRLVPAWLAAIACVSLYKPLSPVAHSYLNIPLMLVWSVSLAVLVSLVLSTRGQGATLRLVAAMMVLSLGVTARPELCAFGPTLRALSAFGQGRLPDQTETPPGYRKGTVETTAYYPWRDYRAVLDYLRRETPPGTPLANLLKGDPAITSPTARPSVFPAESIAWLRMVRPGDEPRFAEALARAPGAVVVWAPGEVGPDPEFKVERLEAVVREHYRPAARFGAIEVWRRRPPMMIDQTVTGMRSWKWVTRLRPSSFEW